MYGAFLRYRIVNNFSVQKAEIPNFSTVWKNFYKLPKAAIYNHLYWLFKHIEMFLKCMEKVMGSKDWSRREAFTKVFHLQPALLKKKLENI